jgi:hypothetical protein
MLPPEPVAAVPRTPYRQQVVLRQLAHLVFWNAQDGGGGPNVDGVAPDQERLLQRRAPFHLASPYRAKRVTCSRQRSGPDQLEHGIDAAGQDRCGLVRGDRLHQGFNVTEPVSPILVPVLGAQDSGENHLIHPLPRDTQDRRSLRPGDQRVRHHHRLTENIA